MSRPESVSAADSTVGNANPASLLELTASCEIGGVETAAHTVIAHGKARSGGYACFCNVHLLTLAQRDEDVRVALRDAWKRFPDGAPVAWLQRRTGHPHAGRIGGPDLMPRVADVGRGSGLRHFLFGSTAEIGARVERALSERYPGVEIVGRLSPPFSATGPVDPSVVDVIAQSDPDVVWCALGAPKQELWMNRASPLLPGMLLLGVGAAFDFLASTKQRAPEWMRDYGLEWAHRLASEPTRLGGRYLTTNSSFIVRAGSELTRRRLGM